MTIVGAWVTRFLIGQLRSYYMIWATQRIDRQISSYIKDENNTTEHIRNLQAKRERLQIRTIDLMEENLLSTDVIAGIVPNQALESTRSPHAALRWWYAATLDAVSRASDPSAAQNTDDPDQRRRDQEDAFAMAPDSDVAGAVVLVNDDLYCTRRERPSARMRGCS